KGIDTATWANWRWKNIIVMGTGANTKVLAGASASNRGNHLLTTTDGNNFTDGSFLALGGGTALIPGRDPSLPDDLWAYGGLYPGNSNGADSSYGRYIATPPFTDNFINDTTFTSPS